MYSAIDLIRDVWVYVRPRKGRFFVASLLRVASDIAWLYPPYALAIVVEYLSHYTVGMSMTPVYTPIALSFVAIVIRYAGLYLGKNTMFVLSERAALDAQMRAMRHIMMLDTSWHEAENSGNKFKRIDRGADSVDRIIRIWITDIHTYP
ncbi:MAG: hypothetical protein M1459_00315 [Patescibacteria group bacterium]|nr:hypothetical protein [Patescibacteria group bacterium]